MKRKSTSEKRKNELTDLNIGRRMIINNGKYEEYIDNLNGKDIALKAIEYAKDKNPYMRAFIRQAYIAAYQQAIKDIYGALWHHNTEEPVNERRNERNS